MLSANGFFKEHTSMSDFWDAKYNALLSLYSFITIKWVSYKVSDVRFTTNDSTTPLPFGGSGQKIYVVFDTDGEFASATPVISAQRIVDSPQAKTISSNQSRPLKSYWKVPRISRVQISTADFKSALTSNTDLLAFFQGYFGANITRFPNMSLLAHETDLVAHFKFTGSIGFELHGYIST